MYACTHREEQAKSLAHVFQSKMRTIGFDIKKKEKYKRPDIFDTCNLVIVSPEKKIS